MNTTGKKSNPCAWYVGATGYGNFNPGPSVLRLVYEAGHRGGQFEAELDRINALMSEDSSGAADAIRALATLGKGDRAP